jgi:hypothetical protein
MLDRNGDKCLSVQQLQKVLEKLDPGLLVCVNHVGNLMVYSDTREDGEYVDVGFIDFLLDGEFERFADLVEPPTC